MKLDNLTPDRDDVEEVASKGDPLGAFIMGPPDKHGTMKRTPVVPVRHDCGNVTHVEPGKRVMCQCCGRAVEGPKP